MRRSAAERLRARLRKARRLFFLRYPQLRLHIRIRRSTACRDIPPPGFAEKLVVMARHIEKLCEYKGEYIGMREARKHIGYYLKGFHGAAALRKQAGTVSTLKDMY